MKTKVEAKKKIKEIKDIRLKSEGVLFSYWLGYQRALEWLLTEDMTNEKRKNK